MQLCQIVTESSQEIDVDFKLLIGPIAICNEVKLNTHDLMCGNSRKQHVFHLVTRASLLA